MGRETARLGLLIFARSLGAPEAPGLQLKMRERARFRHGACRSRRKRAANRLFDLRSHVLCIIAGNDFDLHFEVIHLMQSCQRYRKLIDSSKLANHRRLKMDFNVERAEPHCRTKSYALRHLQWAAH